MPPPLLSRRPARTYIGADVSRHISPSSLVGVPPCGGIPCLLKLRPCSPLEQGLIFFRAPKTFSFGSNTLTFPCTRCMADMSVAALQETLDSRIYRWSMRHPPVPSSLGPGCFPARIYAEPPPSAGSTGKRRFLLPRPFATTFMGLHLRMEPLFFVAASTAKSKNA
jgi:hypothetical protein